MPIEVKGKSYYSVSEASQLSDVSLRTVYRWMHQGIINGGKLRNRKGWRLFTEDDIEELTAKPKKVRKISDWE